MAKAKFDIKTEATRPLYAGVGFTDLAVEAVRDYVADVQKTFAEFDFAPVALRDVIEARVTELQSEAQALVTDGVETFADTYAELVKRGEVLVTRIRNQEATKATVKSANTTTAKAKTTKTQAKKTTKSAAKKTSAGAKSTAKKATTTAKKSSAPSSAKATATAAKKTASNATTAVSAAADKVGN
jgi:cobalamin biosynthesis Mg chelatase CobN